MRNLIYKSPNEKFVWVDFENPSKQDLEALAKDFPLHNLSLQDCLDPEHLPKHEFIDGIHFFILRAVDNSVPEDADTVPEMTAKIALFVSNNFVITVHRRKLDFWTKYISNCNKIINPQASMATDISLGTLRSVLDSYEAPIRAASERVDAFETIVFTKNNTEEILEDIYYLKRRAVVYKKVLKMMWAVLTEIEKSIALKSPLIQDTRERIDRLVFMADELAEDVTNLLNVHLSISSAKTNHVMKILTVFSVVIMPLNLIAGIYGMNFKHMPELEWDYGYWASLGMMAFVALGGIRYFKRNKWM